MATFRVYLGRELLGEYQFAKGPIMVGRHPASDIFISQDVISRRHAIFKRTGRTWSVANAGSQNGLFINGTFVNEGPLADADRVELGGCVIQIFYEKSDGARADNTAKTTHVQPCVEKLNEAGAQQTLIAAPTRSLNTDASAADEKVEDEDNASTVTLTVKQVGQLHALNAQTQGAHVHWMTARGHQRRTIRKDRPLIIGRGRLADIPVKGTVGISSNFARLFVTERDVFIERCSRLVPIKVNGITIRGEQRLHDGDQISVGNLELTYRSGLFQHHEG